MAAIRQRLSRSDATDAEGRVELERDWLKAATVANFSASALVVQRPQVTSLWFGDLRPTKPTYTLNSSVQILFSIQSFLILFHLLRTGNRKNEFTNFHYFMLGSHHFCYNRVYFLYSSQVHTGSRTFYFFAVYHWRRRYPLRLNTESVVQLSTDTYPLCGWLTCSAYYIFFFSRFVEIAPRIVVKTCSGPSTLQDRTRPICPIAHLVRENI